MYSQLSLIHNKLLGKCIECLTFWGIVRFDKKHSGEWFRSTDLWVMSPARYHCATPLVSEDPTCEKPLNYPKALRPLSL